MAASASQRSAAPSPAGLPIRHRYIDLGARHVHYLRAGTGPPAVLVHSTPASSEFLRPLIARLARDYTVFAFDTPGFGDSDAIAIDATGAALVARLADALAEVMRALAFERTPVFGTHTGAALALELAVRHPDLVTGIVLDGLPLYTADEVELRAAHGYFAPLVLDPLGGYLTATWTRFRDQSTFSPWPFRSTQNTIRSGFFPTPQSIHRWVMMFYQAARNYAAPYRAVHDYGAVAAERIAVMEPPAVFTAGAGDWLSKHFNRFPSLKPEQALVRLGFDEEEKMLLIERSLARFAASDSCHGDITPAPALSGVQKTFVDLADSQILVRTCGAAARAPIILLHDAPGSAHALEPLMRALGLRHRVFAPDLPGCGQSGPLASIRPSIADYAEAVQTLCRHFDLTSVSVYAIGFGASVAIELGRLAPELVNRLILRGVLLPDDAERSELQQNYAPPLSIEPDGGHWYRAWLMLRDSLLYWPWYRRSVAAIRNAPADLSSERLHDWTFELMRQHDSYHHVIDAALDQRADRILPGLGLPMLLCRDGAHPFSAFDDTLATIAPNALRLSVSPNIFEHAAQVAEFIAEGTGL